MDSCNISEPFQYSTEALRGDPLVHDTRQEIRRIVQEVAALSRSRISSKRYWGRFLTLVSTSIGATGSIVWQRHPAQWQAIEHVGAVSTSVRQGAEFAAEKESTLNCHQRMLIEVGNAGGPVVVPPGASWESTEPGNPTDQLAALLPVPVDPDEPTQWMVEFFIPPGGGPAAQRGYLRFLAQMADLAGDFVRSDRLRDLRRQVEFQDRFHLLLNQLYHQDDKRLVYQGLVDGLATLLRAERISLATCTAGTCRLLAVSGVDQLDRRAVAVQALTQIAAEGDPRKTWTAAETSDWEEKDNETSQESQETRPQETANEGEPLEVLELRGVAVLDESGRYRLVVEDRQGMRPEPELDANWEFHARQLGRILCERPGAWPFGLGTPEHRMEKSLLRRAAVPLGVLAALTITALLPFPLTVAVEGRLTPLKFTTHYAPRDGIIAEILVQHGDPVTVGTPLIRMVDASLEHALANLTGREAVLEQRYQELMRQKNRQNRQGNSQNGDVETLLQQIRVCEEEIQTVRAELQIARDSHDALLIRSQSPGVVDAWQVEQRLSERPVQRGLPLLRVIPQQEYWSIEADIPQNRLDHVIAAQLASSDLRARVSVPSFPSLRLEAALREIGPAMRPAGGLETVGKATFQVDPQDLPLQQWGAPVKLAIPCGSRPLVYIFCQDLIRMIQGTMKLYW